MIDVHSHLFFDELLGLVPPLGPSVAPADSGWELVVGGYRWPLRQRELTASIEQRVADLDAAEIDVQVVSLSPLWLFPDTDDMDAVNSFHQKANTVIAGWRAPAPDRVRAVASLPIQDPQFAVAELERSVHELGALGGYLGTSGRWNLDDRRLDPLYERFVELNVPLFIHSTMPGVDRPGDPRLSRWMGGVIYGYPFEETLAVSALIFGGVLERHPLLDIVISHGGGASAMLHGRMREFSGTSRSPITTAQFDTAFGRLWFDTHVHSAAGIELLRSVADPERLVYGSNFGGWDSSSVDEVASIADTIERNAARLLRLR